MRPRLTRHAKQRAYERLRLSPRQFAGLVANLLARKPDRIIIEVVREYDHPEHGRIGLVQDDESGRIVTVYRIDAER